MKAPKAPQPAKFLAALIRTAYLPQELPPAITTREFAKFCDKEYSYLNSQKGSLLKSNTQYGSFSAPNQKTGRRSFAIVHPLGQLAVSLTITQHREEIRKFISKSKISLYRTDEDLKNEKAFRGLDFRKWNTLKSKAQSEYPFILSADISSFFYTIYTHSIPWAVIGKELAKTWNNTDKAKLLAHWSNDFDKAIQCCQSRETFGIPVGPDTSRLIAEILMAGIEADSGFSAWLKNRLAFRLVDDFTVGFESDQDARKALGALRNALWKFNLRLNDEKTKVVASRHSLKDRWEIEQDLTPLSDINPTQQLDDLARILDLTLHQCAEAGTDAPAFRATNRITAPRNTSDNFSLILDVLFHLAREFPRCVSLVASFLINNRDRCLPKQRMARVTKWVRDTLSAHSIHGHDYEVSWCIVVCGALNIKIRKADIKTESALPNPIVLVLLGLLKERRLLTQPLSNWPWKAEFQNSGVDGPYWLFFYEAVRRKWTADKKIVDAVKSDPILKKMIGKKVTFLEHRVFDTSAINISSRTFKKASPGFVQLPPSLKKTKDRKKKVRTFADIIITAADLDY